MTYQSFTLSRFIGDDADHGTTFTVADDDAVNVAHMLAAGFNTMSRNFMNGAVLAVVYSDGRVQYDGKAEMLNRIEPPGPYTVSRTFKFEPSAGDADTILTLFGNGETPTFKAAGKMSFVEESEYAHIAREVLESTYEEMQHVRAALETVGVETIPPSAGVRELIRRNDFEFSARTAYEQQHSEENEATRAEMISFVKRAHAKKVRIQASTSTDEPRADLDNRWRGMLDVLAKFLVVTGEADKDESHAVARRLCEIED